MSVNESGNGAFDADENPTDCLWRRNPEWMVAPFDDSLVMLDIGSGRYFGLNRSAAVIWDVLDKPNTAEGIKARLLQLFDVSPDVCAAGVGRILRQLGDLGAILPA